MKNNKKGISLIVLVITIIVIIILAAAVILTLNNNNPIKEANDARYSSDTANMQAVLTNTVAKIMAANQSTITITPETFTDAALTTQIHYALDYPMSEAHRNGVIVFNTITGSNPSTEKSDEDSTTDVDCWYTGKALPNYNAGTETWSIDAEGTLTLTVRSNEEGKSATYPASGVVESPESGS